MEKQSYLSKSRYLLLFLFALIVGTGSAWADTLTEDFNSVTLSGTPVSTYYYSELSNGWKIAGGGYITAYDAYSNYTLGSTYKRGDSGNAIYANYGSSNSSYVIIPTKLTGDVTFYARRVSKNAASIYVYEAVESEKTYTTTGSALLSKTYSKLSSYETLPTTWEQLTVSLGDEGKMLAIQLVYTAIDNFSATIYEDTSGPGFAVKDGSTTLSSPYAYNFGLATAGTTKVFKLTNPGTVDTPIAVDVTGANGFTAAVEGNATSIPAGGEKELTITMPAASASGSVVVTPTGDGLSAFTFNVSGTVRDPNKVFLDFLDGKIPDGWTSVAIGSYASSYGSEWAASEGYVSQSGSSSSYEWAFTSPKLTFSEGETILFETEKSIYLWS